MFGSELLVAPVLEAGADSRQVYLPAGTWTLLETGGVFQGSQDVQVSAPVDVIPVFRKQSA